MRKSGILIGSVREVTFDDNRGGVDLVVITQRITGERLEELRSRCSLRGVALERLHFALDQLVAAS